MWGDADNIDLIEERLQRVHKFMMWSQENRSLIGTLDPITLFNLLDKDKDSLLDVEDIRLGFKTMGLELSHPEAQSFFNMMDVDGNDAVDIAEFVSFVREFILASETTNPAPPVGGVSAAAGTNSTLTPNGSININSTSGLPLGSINSTSHTSHFSGMNGNVNISMNHGYYPNESSGRSIAGSIISTSSATPGMQAIKERILREERVRSHSRSRRSSVTSLDRDRILAAAASTSTLTPVSKQDNKSVNAILSMNSHLQSGTPSHRGRSINRNTNTRVNTSQNNIENAPLLHTNADHVDDDLENGGDAGVTTKSLYDQSQQSQTSQTAESHGLLTGINTIKQNGSIISQNGKSIQSYGSTGSIAAETEAETGVEGGPPTLVRQPSYSSQSTFIQAKAHPFGSTQANLYNNPNMTISSNIAYMQSQVQSGINNPNITPGMSTDQMPMQMHLNPEKLNMLNAMGISGTIPGMGNIPHNIPNIPNVHSMPNMSNTHTIPTINPQQPETVIDLYTDPNRREEALEKNSMVPPLPPELMGIIIEWICDQNRTESVLIRVGTKHRWALHLWAARTGKLLHFSTTDPYTNERVLKLSKLPQCFTQVRENKSGNVSGNVSGIATPGLMSMSSNGGIITNNMNINQSNNPRSSTTSRTYPYQNSNNEYPYQIDSNSNPAFDRVWTETDLPRWASASNKITNFVRQHPGCTIQTVFAEADTDKRGSVTLANLISFCARFDIDIPAHAVKIFFYTNDADHDRALAIQDFKHFLESLVRVPEELEEVDRLMREVEDETLEHDLAMAGLSTYIDPAHAHMQGWSEKRKKMYGIGLLLFGISIVAFFSDPMIEVIGAFSVNINVKPFYVSFVVTPFVSNASEVIASLMFARAKTNVSMGLTLSSLYGAVTMNNTLCMCIFLAIITTRGLAWRYTAEVLTIITIECIVASIVMRETLRQWQAVIIGSLFPLSILMVYVLEVWGVNG